MYDVNIEGCPESKISAQSVENSNSDSETDMEEDEEDEEEILDAKDMTFTSKETYYYKMIDKFFRSIPYADTKKMVDIIEGRSEISLRLLDWFVTRYANKKKTSYPMSQDFERFNVHISYKAQLRSYKKRYFDPFRRRKKFNYCFYNNQDKNNKNNNGVRESMKLYTTIGQLNFFRWAFSNNIIKYVEMDFEAIAKAMVLSNKEDKKRKKVCKTKSKKYDVIRFRKNDINISANKKIKEKEIKIVVAFD